MHLFGSGVVGGLMELEVDCRDVRRRRGISRDRWGCWVVEWVYAASYMI